MNFRQIARDYFTFTRTEKRGLWLVGIAMLLAGVLPAILGLFPAGDAKPLSIAPIRFEKSGPVPADTFEGTIKYQAFNPNTVTRQELTQMGLSAYVVDNWMKYRAAGGKFYRRDDVLTIYGLKKPTYLALRKYIKLPRSHWSSGYGQWKDREPSEPVDINRASLDELIGLPGIGPYYASTIIEYRKTNGGFDSVGQLADVYGLDSAAWSSVQEWLVAGPLPDSVMAISPDNDYRELPRVMDLNAVDSAVLVRLTGIGPFFANRIIKFRDALGGFYSNRQLQEVYDLPIATYLRIKGRFCVDTSHIRKLDINEAASGELARHPYISDALANFIVIYRMSRGEFSTLDEIKESYLVDDALYQKLKHYLQL